MTDYRQQTHKQTDRHDRHTFPNTGQRLSQNEDNFQLQLQLHLHLQLDLHLQSHLQLHLQLKLYAYK